MAQLMQAGSRDFLSGDGITLASYFDLAIDIHHIFPRKYCRDQQLDSRRFESIVNKAPLSARTNRIIGGDAPSKYLAGLERNHAVARLDLDATLRSHLIDPDLLRVDDFGGFVQGRATALLDLIEGAMGKRVPGRDSEDVVQEFGAALVASSQ